MEQAHVVEFAAIGVEVEERYCEAIARRLEQAQLSLDMTQPRPVEEVAAVSSLF